MESQFLTILQPHEREGFFLYSKSLRDIATQYKCLKEPQADGKKIKTDRAKGKLQARLIFGIGDVPRPASEACRMVPSSISGFINAINAPIAPKINLKKQNEEQLAKEAAADTRDSQLNKQNTRASSANMFSSQGALKSFVNQQFQNVSTTPSNKKKNNLQYEVKQ